MDDKVSMLTHIYPHKPLGEIEVTICNHQADSPLYDVMMFDLVICKFRKTVAKHDTKCPYWDQVSLSNTNQTLEWFVGGDSALVYYYKSYKSKGTS